MKEPKDCTDMNEIREAIDSIDDKIVELIANRSLYVKEAARFKKDEAAVRDSKRVEAVISSRKALAQKYGISAELIGNIYRTMINFFIDSEMKEWKSK